MTTGRIELGPTGRAVAANVKRLREARRLTLRALSGLMREHGRPLSADALNKIENGASEEPRPIRRVDADDLMALAVVLDVHPAALLLPPSARDTDRVTGEQVTVSVTAAGEVPARSAWQWAHGMRGLTLADGETELENWHRFADSALPDTWEGMSAQQYEEWRAERARQKYEHILERTGFNPDGTRREGGGGG